MKSVTPVAGGQLMTILVFLDAVHLGDRTSSVETRTKPGVDNCLRQFTIRDARDAKSAGRDRNMAWRTLFEAYRTRFPKKAGQPLRTSSAWQRRRAVN
jgi:hypothetical protein